MRQQHWYFLLFALAVLLSACGSVAGEVTINTSGMLFTPREVHIKTGRPVTLHVVNRDGFTHAFDIDELDIHTTLPAWEKFDVTFTPTDPGRYRFYCGSPGHEAAGMVGVLVVEP
jgi:uncharacterized cupredoxin-like copper-binding protein